MANIQIFSVRSGFGVFLGDGLQPATNGSPDRSGWGGVLVIPVCLPIARDCWAPEVSVQDHCDCFRFLYVLLSPPWLKEREADAQIRYDCL